MKAMKKNLFQRVLTLALMLTIVFSMGVTPVFAAPDTYKEDSSGAVVVPDEYVSTVTDGELKIWRNNGATGKDDVLYVFKLEEGKVVQFKAYDYTKTPPEPVAGAVNPFKNLQLDGSQQAMDAIQDIKDLTNVHADLSAAQGTLEPLIEIVNTVIGVLATAILILVGLFTAIDILYLEVPAFHNTMDQKGMEKGQTNKSGGVKHKLISEDASQAFQEASENGKNPMIVYLKKRIVAYVAVAIVLYMLLSGNLSLIVEVVLKMLNGVFGWVEDYSATM